MIESWASSTGGLNEGLGPLEQLRWLFHNDAEFHALAVLIEPFWAHVYREVAYQDAYDVAVRTTINYAQVLREHVWYRYKIRLRERF